MNQANTITKQTSSIAKHIIAITKNDNDDDSLSSSSSSSNNSSMNEFEAEPTKIKANQPINIPTNSLPPVVTTETQGMCYNYIC